jgi:lipoate-protein ligase A
MAIDQALLDLADRDGIAALRLYGWAPHCLSFGRHEPALRRYDRAAVAALGLDAVRRPTGGRAVRHEQELTYAVAAPAAFLGSLAEAYAAIHRMLAEALDRVGVRSTFAPRPARAAPVDAGDCFAQAAGGELLVNGAKLVGSAQLRSGAALLQHGSIRLPPTPDVVAAVAGAAREAWPSEWRPFPAEGFAEEASRRHPQFQDPAWTWRR